MYRIMTDFAGANCKVLSMADEHVYLDVELRDTQEDWFYWCFKVEGAKGKTITFSFPSSVRVGYYGAAVSHDYETWHWQYDDKGHEGRTFSYTFAEDEDSVWFAHDILYRPERFLAFAASHRLCVKTLAISEKGRDIPYIELGQGDEVIFLTARHHACESTGSYVLEGVLDAMLLDSFFSRYRIICVPFVDFDGVIDGDQGKSRAPYDHNRDYQPDEEPLYRAVREIRRIAKENQVRFAFDFHSPWHLGGCNDTVFIPIKHHHILKNIIRFSSAWEKEAQEAQNALPHFASDDMLPDVDWNKFGTPCFGTYMGNIGAELAFTVETPYFSAREVQFSPEKAIATGRHFVHALKQYIEKPF